MIRTRGEVRRDISPPEETNSPSPLEVSQCVFDRLQSPDFHSGRAILMLESVCSALAFDSANVIQIAETVLLSDFSTNRFWPAQMESSQAVAIILGDQFGVFVQADQVGPYLEAIGARLLDYVRREPPSMPSAYSRLDSDTR